jgi:ACR3 family arsenite efflux pump ArsB
MCPGLLALVAASGFSGATLYINLVEQPARMAVGGRAMIREWVPSNRRGLVMLSILALASGLLAYSDFSRSQDVRWLIGGAVILASLPYTFFVMVPVNIWLAEVSVSGRAMARRLM